MPTEDPLAPPLGWATAPSARIPTPPPSERGLAFRIVGRASSLFGRASVPDIFSVLHLRPPLFWSWLLFASRLMPFGALDARVREKLILRTGWNCRSRYEWGQHVDLALRVGVTDDEIVRVARGPEACTDRHERALLEACDELCGRDVIGDATWAVLAERYDDALRVELMMLIGHYRMIAGFLNSAGLALEPAAEAKLQAFYARVR